MRTISEGKLGSAEASIASDGAAVSGQEHGQQAGEQRLEGQETDAMEIDPGSSSKADRFLRMTGAQSRKVVKKKGYVVGRRPITKPDDILASRQSGKEAKFGAKSKKDASGVKISKRVQTKLRRKTMFPV